MIFLLLVSGSEASAQKVKVLGVAGQSAKIVTSGIQSTSTAYKTFPSSTVTVYYTSTTTLVPLFTTAAGSVTLANPLTASTDASFGFFAQPGITIDIRFSGTGITTPFTLSSLTVPGGSQGATVMACLGTNDTAALAAASTAAQTIIIPKGVTCASNSQTIAPPMDIQYGGLLKPITGQTVILTGAQLAGPWQTFTNATSGLGTISFSGNAAIRSAYAEWWGAAPASTATVNSAALNATNAALVSIAAGIGSAGDILLGGSGTYDINATVNIGSDAAAFTGIGLAGTNGLVGTKLRWTGSTSGTAIYLTRGRYNHLRDFQLTSSVAKGTTIGLRMSGPNTGTNTSGVMMERVDINTFHIGLLAGDGTGAGHDSSEFTAIGSTFESNDIGFQSDGFNTLNLHFYSCNVDSNTTAGMVVSFGGTVHIYGGAWGRNPIGINVTAATPLFVSGVRDEAIAGSKFIVSTAAGITSQITVIGCSFPTNPGNETISGVGQFTLIGNQFGTFATAVTPFKGGGTGGTSLTMIGNVTQDGTALFNSDVNSNGMTYNVSNNIKLDSFGVSTKWDDESGIIDGSGNRVVLSKKVWGASSATQQLNFATISASGQITSTLATGTAPFIIASITKVSNLNVDQLDGQDWTSPTFTTSAISPLWRSTVAKILFQGTGSGASQLASTQTTPPTCTSNCGTSPSVVGSDSDMRVTMGATGVPASGFVITFNGTWAAAPVCSATMSTTGMVVGKLPLTVVTTTTTITIVTNGTAPSNSDTYAIMCRGTQ